GIVAVRVAVDGNGRRGNVHWRWLAVDDCWRLLRSSGLLRRLSMKQPHSCRLLVARPSTGGLIDRHILLRGCAGVGLECSVLNDHYTLYLLTIDDNCLWDTLLAPSR